MTEGLTSYCCSGECWEGCSALFFPCKIMKGKRDTLRLGMCLANVVKLIQVHKER